MIEFIQHSTISIKLLYVITFTLFFMYMYKKITEKKYLFSIFNIGIYIFMFTVLIIGPFQYADKAWIALGHTKANTFYQYLNKEFTISLIGIIIFLTTLIYLEFKYTKGKFLENSINKISNNINEKSVLIINIFLIIAWYIVILITIKTLPIFGHRTFADEYGIQPIYIALNTGISMFMLYYGFMYVFHKDKKYILPLTINIFTSFATGNRGPLLIGILCIVMIAIYINYNNSIRINIGILLVGIIMLSLGMILSIIRDGGGLSNINSILDDILYSNTFSDMRDGAYVLYGFDQKFDTLLYGKNYFADLLSFIPSSLSQFRQEWSYGAFSTYTLFGWEGHYGLRGGWFLQPYINFGYMGVGCVAIIYGLIISHAEKFFYENIVLNKWNINNISYKLIVTNTLVTIASFLLVSSAGAQYYVSVLIIIALVMFSMKFNIKNYKK